MEYASIEVTSSGLTFAIPFIGSGYMPIRIFTSASISLASPISISLAGSSLQGKPARIRWDGTVFKNGQSVTVCGQELAQDIVNQPGVIEVVYNGASFDVQYLPDQITRPQDNQGTETVEIPNAGGSLVVVPGTNKSTYYLVGSPTVLANNYTVTVDTTGLTDGAKQTFYIGPDTTIGSNVFTVCGKVINAYDALNGGVRIDTEFSSTSGLLVTYVNQSIVPDKFSVSGLGSGDNGKIPYYDFASGKFVYGFLPAASFGTAFAPVYIAKTRLLSASILTGNATPIGLVSAPGAGKFIDVLDWANRIVYNSSAYATNTTLAIRHVGGATDLLTDANIMLSTASRILRSRTEGVLSGTTNGQIVENAGVEAYVKTNNPTAGNSDIYTYLWYTVNNI